MSKLKTFSKNFNVPIILLCQLNREVDSRAVKRPTNSDLRDSGSIEQDANQIIMLYREGAYKANTDNPYSEAIITKNRFGELGTAYMRFDKGHFVDCDQAKAYQELNENHNKHKKLCENLRKRSQLMTEQNLIKGSLLIFIKQIKIQRHLCRSALALSG